MVLSSGPIDSSSQGGPNGSARSGARLLSAAFIRQERVDVSEAWRSGESYEALMGRWSRLLAPRFLEWARPPLDGTILDVGCGTGALSWALLRSGAQTVVGVDPSPTYVALASAHVGREGDARFCEGSAMDLPFSDDRFAVALSSLALNFVPDPRRAMHEMHRVVRQGGTVAACVWDYAGRMELARIFWDAATVLKPDAKALDEGGRFPICNPGNLAQVFREAGLSGVETTNIDLPLRFADFEDFWSPFLGGQGPAAGYVVGLSEKDRTSLRELLRSRVPTQTDGSIPMIARAWAARGVRD